MPYVVETEKGIKERVGENDFKGTALELMNRVSLLSSGSDRQELSWFCDAVMAKYGPVENLVTTLATKAMEQDDGKLLAIAATLAKALYPAGAKAEKKEKGLHKAFVTGVVQTVLFHCSIPEGAETTMADSVRAGYKGINDDTAKFFIFEWIKDGAATGKSAREDVLAGDYSSAWKFANTWLETFGYERAEPEEITLSDTSYATIIAERPEDERV